MANVRRLSSSHVERMASRIVNQTDGEPLTALQFKFCVEYSQIQNGTQAAVNAGYSPKTAPVMAHTLLRMPKIRAEIARQARQRAAVVQKTSDDVARYWWLIATQDIRDLVPVYTGCCRHCYGIEHQYQFESWEMHQAMRKHERVQRNKPPHEEREDFDDKGGDGYDHTMAPVRDCPHCHGEGVMRPKSVEYLKALPPALAMMISGFKINKAGEFEVRIREDRARAMENFQAIMGFVRPRKLVLDIDPGEMDDEQLATFIRRLRTVVEAGEGPKTIDARTEGTGGEGIWTTEKEAAE